jgi:hypothetical protein
MYNYTYCKPGFLDDHLLQDTNTSLVFREIKKEVLLTLLTSHNIDISKWGSGESKTVSSLHREIKRGIADLRITGRHLTRICIVARISVFDSNANQLVEVGQEFKNTKRIRHRNNQNHINKKVRYLWDDSVAGCESISVAARRALFEELAIPLDELDKIEYAPQGIEKCYTSSSQSYPGLPTFYFISHFDVNLGSQNTKHLIKPHYIWEGKELITTFAWKPKSSL